MYPLLIADSGGTKTDWCFVNSNGSKQFFTTESYHPQNWSNEFLERIHDFWLDYSEFKTAKLYFFCAGCFHVEQANRLFQIFSELGFANIIVKSDLHAAAIALYGNEEGYCAILGTGSVFFEWKNQEVISIAGGKGHKFGDEGSGFHFGKLLYQARVNNELSAQQRDIFDSEVDLVAIEKAISSNSTKAVFSEISSCLSNNSENFKDWHLQNIDLFFDDVWKSKEPLELRVVGGYFAANSKLFTPYLAEKQIYIRSFSARPIESLVDYFIGLIE